LNRDRNSGEPCIPISYGSTETIDTGNWSPFKPQSLVLTPPCREACPIGTDIPLFLHFIERGLYPEALLAILRENPFPGVCGRVCFHPCESACNRVQNDEAVSIQMLERFVSSETAESICPQPAVIKDSRKVAIIGAGPAGLACAYFLALLGHYPTIYEAKKEPGGVMRWGIPQFRLPKIVLKKEIRRILSLPIELKTRCRVGKEIAFEELERFDAIFLSPGAGLNASLSIEGEDLDGVCSGGEFLERIKAEETISSAERTIVIGGGNTAMDVARSALRLGSKVTIAYRRTREELPAFKDEIIEAEEEGMDFSFLLQPVKIRRAHSGKLEVVFQRMVPGAPDAGNRRRAIPVDGEFLTLEADRVISAVGEWVDHSWIPNELVKDGLIKVGSVSRIFAGGDAVLQPRTIATAIASAKRAAVSMDLWFQGIHAQDVLSKIKAGDQGSFSLEAYLQGREKGIWNETGAIVSPEQINTLYFEKSKRAKSRKLSFDKRRQTFLEVNLRTDARNAALSASRCYFCGMCNACCHCYYLCPEGVISIDPDARTRKISEDHCKGCGICARSCPRHAVFMKDLS
jgi:NADPH-dependent glutamate synthase beta subunit-like oxidoreductase/Pyruvate/2-oxoacid:ferredoxin oxidoreductase delta subunit